MAERLQKLISASGLMSRRAAEECIAAGRVTVNGIAAALGEKADPAVDTILVDGKKLPSAERKKYIMLNKPKGYVCTLSDEKGRKNVTELVDIPGVRLYPVGRLDMYSEGLLIMTNDGDFAHRLMHPSNDVQKNYRTWVQGNDIGLAVEFLRGPLDIDGYIVCAESVDIDEVFPNGAILSITINEGRNRQVRKMCECCGLKVTKLLRVSEGPLQLGALKPGKWRDLSEAELAMLK